MPRANQHLPLPPKDVFHPLIYRYFYLKKSDQEISRLIRGHPSFDDRKWGMSKESVKRARGLLGLKHARGQKHTLESIAPYVATIRRKFPQRGYRTITNDLFLNHGIRVNRDLVGLYLRITEPEEVARRKRNRLVRRVVYSAGVNDVWAQDQHDKWRKFGLFLHGSVDIHSGYINWLNIWWTNRNPRLVAGYYLERARAIGGVPLVTQSDPGSENYGTANAHTLIRQTLDASLIGTLQHRVMHKKKNIKPEVLWSVFRRDFTIGFEARFQVGLDNGWYDPDIELEWLIFRWLAIPYMQKEIDIWTNQYNMTARRANKKKVLPHGAPILIQERPQDYDTADFKVNVSAPLFDEVEAQICPRDNPVFELVPPLFEHHISAHYKALGKPVVDMDSFWTVYQDIRKCFLAANLTPDLQQLLSSKSHQNDYEDVPLSDRVDVMEGAPFREGDALGPAPHVAGAPIVFDYFGGLQNPKPPAPEIVAEMLAGWEDDSGVEGGDWIIPACIVVLESDEESDAE